MSVSTTTDRVTYAGDASTTAFSFPYVLFADADLKVYLKTNSTGAETLKTITTHYTVSGTQTNGVYESGVTVTFLTAPTASETVVIIRDRSVTQDLELDENGKIPSQNLEKQLDKLATDVQRVKNKVNRSVALKEGFTATFTPDLPAVMVTDGYLKTNAAGDALEYISQDDLINTINTSASTFTASRALVSDANGLADVSAVTSTELGYVSGVTSAIQTQLNAKAPSASPTFTGTVTTPLTASRAVATGASGELAASATTATELGYVNGVTSAIQTQLNAKAPSASPTFTGTMTIPATVTGASAQVLTMPTSTSTLATLGLNETFTGTKTMQSLAVTTAALDLQVGQIAFPASQNASAGANTLDDYEEGTFSPTVRGAGTAGSGTYTTQVGLYTKVGNLVTFTA